MVDRGKRVLLHLRDVVVVFNWTLLGVHLESEVRMSTNFGWKQGAAISHLPDNSRCIVFRYKYNIELNHDLSVYNCIKIHFI